MAAEGYPGKRHARAIAIEGLDARTPRRRLRAPRGDGARQDDGRRHERRPRARRRRRRRRRSRGARRAPTTPFAASTGAASTTAATSAGDALARRGANRGRWPRSPRSRRSATTSHARRLASVIAPPYDVIYGDASAQELLRAPREQRRAPRSSRKARATRSTPHAAALLDEWRKSGVLVRDNEPAFYRYDQSFLPPGRGGKTITRRGFLAAVRLHPFSERVVLPHERTLSGPKEDRLKLFRATRTQLSPGLHALLAIPRASSTRRSRRATSSPSSRRPTASTTCSPR